MILLNIKLDISASIKIYKGLSIGAFWSQFGPEMSKTLTYTSRGYYYFYHGRWYWRPPGEWTERFWLTFGNSTHTGILLRYYTSPYDKTHKTTWYGEFESFLELGIGQTDLYGYFNKDREKITTFFGSGDTPYYHLALVLRGRVLPIGFWGFNIKLCSSKVSEIKDSNNKIVRNLDDSKLAVDFTSFSLGFGIGVCFLKKSTSLMLA